MQFKTPLSPKGANKEWILSASGRCLIVKSHSLNRQSYDGLEKKLKEVFSERSGILHQLSKTSKELDSIKGNLQVGLSMFIFGNKEMFEGLASYEVWPSNFPASVFIHLKTFLT